MEDKISALILGFAILAGGVAVYTIWNHGFGMLFGAIGFGVMLLGGYGFYKD